MTKVYVAVLEDSEGCGTIEDRLTVHSTRQGAEASFKAMFKSKFGSDRYENMEHADGMTADELAEYLNDEEGKTGGVHEVELDEAYA